ncbi:hypothetical protein [Pelagibacterium sp.]|uniref:hypothetical protein n=1 Tax=Pelagibacterium sp. TaxID=1967288 RepID=UPI003A9014C0
MSPAEVLFHSNLDADDRADGIHDAAVAARAGQANKDEWKAFRAELGLGNAA